MRVAGDWPVFETMFGSVRVRAVLTGMGQDHALKAAQRFLAEKPEICVSTGLAGALWNEYRPGDIVAARLVSEVGEPVAVASHGELLSAAVDCGARRIERLATSKALVTRTEEKQRLSNEAEAVEMESYTILAEAARHGVPGIAVRAVSDAADFDLPFDLARATDARGQIRVANVVSQVLRRPTGLPSLLKLARDCRLASRRLADFLDAYAGTIAERLTPTESDTVAAQ